MKATTILIAFALIVAVSSAQGTNVTGFNCTLDKSLCAKANPMFCCANVVRFNTTALNTTNVTQQCVNQTAGRTVVYTAP